MKYLIFNKKVSLKAISNNADYIEGIEIKNNLFVIPEALYLENKKAIDKLNVNFEIRKVLNNEWISETI